MTLPEEAFINDLAKKCRVVYDSFVPLRAVADKATPGPWMHVDYVGNDMSNDVTFHGCGSVVTMGEDVMGGDIAEPAGDCYPRGGYSPLEDMAFIAESRDAIPRLLEFLEWMTLSLEQHDS